MNILICAVQTLSLLYFYDPLNEAITSTWDRAICDTILNGISIDKRIANFYFLILVLFPLAFIGVSILFNRFCRTCEQKARIVRDTKILLIPIVILYAIKYYTGIPYLYKCMCMLSIVLYEAFLYLFHIHNGKKITTPKHDWKSFDFYFITFWGSLLVLYFTFSIEAPDTVGFNSTPEYIIHGVLKNGNFLLKISLSAILFIIAWLSITFSIKKKIHSLENTCLQTLSLVAWLTIIPLIFAIFMKYAMPVLSKFLNTNFFCPLLDQYNPLILCVFEFSIALIVACYFRKNPDSIIEKLFHCIVLSVTFNILIRNFYVSIALSSFVFFILLILPFRSFYHKCKLLTWLPFIFVFFSELRFILMGRDVFFPYNGLIVFVLIVLFLVFLSGKIQNSSIVYIGGIFSVISIKYFPVVFQHTVGFSQYNSIFEAANHSVFWDTWLQGKVPILDYFSAHALADVFTEAIYAFVNNDYLGMYANPYSFIVITLASLILFLLLKEFISSEYVALFLIIFPVAYSGMRNFILGWIAFIAVMYVYRKISVSRLIIFWVILLFSALYRYDEGVFPGISCIIAFSCYLLLQKDVKSFCKFLTMGICVGLFALFLFGAYLLAQGVSPLSRLREWLSLTLGSSSVWPMSNFGQNMLLSFSFAYVFVPISSVTVLMFVFHKFRRTLELKSILIIALSLTCLLHLRRGIVWHNLGFRGGGAQGSIINFWPWLIALFSVFLTKSKDSFYQARKFTVAMTVCILLSIVLVSQLPLRGNVTAFAGAMETSEANVEALPQEDSIPPRTILDEKTQRFFGEFKDIFDTCLNDDETFLDFANITAIYPFTNRIRPFYTAQSPSLLANDVSQEFFFKEIKTAKIPLVITGNIDVPYILKMGGINHNIRYYKIAEHIYRNYVPMLILGDFTIWSAKGQKEDFLHRLADKDNITLLYNNYDADATLNRNETHQYNLIELPYIWANLDKYHAIDNEILQELTSSQANTFVFSGSKYVNSDKGNYLAFRAENNDTYATEAEITLLDSKDNKISYTYTARIRPGINQYLLRVSQDYYWNAFNIDNVQLKADNVKFDFVRILMGD